MSAQAQVGIQVLLSALPMHCYPIWQLTQDFVTAIHLLCPESDVKHSSYIHEHGDVTRIFDNPVSSFTADDT